jgi:PKD repeat protein
VNNAIDFDALGSSDTDGTIVGYRWDFTNDGTYDTGWLTSATTTHSYSAIGTYTVNLQVKDNAGGTDNDTASATITSEGGAIPTADVNGLYSGYVNHPVTFSSSGSIGGSEGTIVSWYWTFGDGTVSSQQNPTHAYTSSGTFTVTLKVTNNYGQTDTDTTSATITELSPDQILPVADAGGPYSGVVGTPITFDGSGSNDLDGTIVSYLWNFGDSTTGTGVSPTHTFTIPGNYMVILTVTDNESLTHSNSTTVSINVSGSPTIIIAIASSNIEPIEEENEKTFSITVQCEHQPVSNIHLEILEKSNLTIISLPSNISLNPGESRELFITIKAPKLNGTNNSKQKVSDETIILRAVGDGNVTSNTEQVNFKVIGVDETPGFDTIATITAVGTAGALVAFFRRHNGNR